MHNIMIGYKWKNWKGVVPSLVESVAVTGQVPQALKRGSIPLWVLDYEFFPYGRCRVRTFSAQWNPRQARTAHLYPPGTLYWEDTRKASGKRSSAWIIFRGGEKAGLNHLIHRQGYACFIDPEGKLGQTIRRCAETGEITGDNGFWQAQSSLCEILNMLVNSAHVSAEIYRIRDEGLVTAEPLLSDRVDAFLKGRISEKTRLEDIARHLHISVSLLSHRYKEEKGYSPMSALIRLRVNYAKSLLFKGYPLKSIASQLGFVDAFHFSKTFKHIEGISPREFLKKPEHSST